MAELDINAEIAERIMGWTVDRDTRHYRDPFASSGGWDWLPDFRFVKQDYNWLLEKMKCLGYALTESQNPPDVKKKIGPCCAACFTRQGESFQATHGDARLAVCLAALAAHGLPTHE